MVGPDGLEPSTPRLSSACSNQLSYWPLSELDSQNEKFESYRSGNCEKRYEDSDLLSPYHGQTMQSAFRKEVIQPQVPLRLPCYDLVPVTDPTVVGYFLAVSAPTSGGTNSHHLTGGVYKTRERIHRGVLIHDY